MNQIITNYIEHLGKKAKPKQRVFDAAELQQVWMFAGSLIDPEYVFDESAKVMFPILFAPTVSKGACFCGPKGIGKTLNLDIFTQLNTDLMKIETEAWEVTELEIQYKASGALFLERLGKLPALVLNDVGIESVALNDYGTTRNIVADLLFLRYREFQVNQKRTYLSTNKTWETLKAHYGARLSDRMTEMFLPMQLKGESKRK